MFLIDNSVFLLHILLRQYTSTHFFQVIHTDFDHILL